MAKPGPKPKVSDERLMLELLIAGERVFASEIQEHVELKTTQGVRDRLNELAEDTEYVDLKKASGRNLYGLTDEGRDYVLEELRDRF